MNLGGTSEGASDALVDAISQLRRAAIAGDGTLVRELLKQHGGLAGAHCQDGRTALRVAVEHGQLAIIPVLRDHGADIDIPDEAGLTLLHHAVDRNDVPLSTTLLNCGANVDAVPLKGEKPLWVAARKGHEPVAKLLLQCKADVESFNPRSRTTALLEAIDQGHVGLVKLLLDNGADIEARQVHGGGYRLSGPDLHSIQRGLSWIWGTPYTGRKRLS